MQKNGLPIFHRIFPFPRRPSKDGFITNMVVYPSVCAVFGYDIRQAIGGDFGFSRRAAEAFLAQTWPAKVLGSGLSVSTRKLHRISWNKWGCKPHKFLNLNSFLTCLFDTIVCILLSRRAFINSFWMRFIALSLSICGHKVEKYGIDIFMTTTVLKRGYSMVEVELPPKIHSPNLPKIKNMMPEVRVPEAIKHVLSPQNPKIKYLCPRVCFYFCFVWPKLGGD